MFTSKGFTQATSYEAPTVYQTQEGCKEKNHPARQGAPSLTTCMPNRTRGRCEGQQERLGPRLVPLFPRLLEGFLEEAAPSWALKTENSISVAREGKMES